MQLMWLSGPTSQVKIISLTARNILLAALCLAAGLLLLGFLLNWVGLRIAVEYNPDLARKLGGVTTELEQKRMEAVYRERLDQLKYGGANVYIRNYFLCRMSVSDTHCMLAQPTRLLVYSFTRVIV